MKFDYAIGNPPYQEQIQDTSDKPVYNYFINAYEIRLVSRRNHQASL